MVPNTSEEEKEEIIRTLLVIQPNCTEAYARQLLEKCNWNVDQAATTLLDAVAENAARAPKSTLDPYVASGTSNISNPPPARPNSVIDLTMDEDEDLATVRAVEASLNSQPPAYGPANLDKSSWALVPTNGPPVLTQEDRALNEALEASLNASFVASQEPYEEPIDVKERLRKTGFPVALRSTDPSLIHVPVVMQCLLSIPKIQERIRMYDPGMSSDDEVDHNICKDLQRVSACLALSARAYIPVDSLLEYPHFDSFRVSKNHQPLAGSIREYYQYLARHLERVPCGSPRLDHDRLLEFQGGTELETEKTNDFHIEVNIPTPYGNDLMSCLAHSFSKAGVCLSRLSECFVFLICRDDPASPLKYPSRIYMDRFFKDNIEHANKLMLYQEGAQHEILKLETDRLKITNWQNNDTLKAFRSSLYYLENLVNDNGDLARRAKNEEAKTKLRSIITEMEANVHYLDIRIKEITNDVENLFDMPEFQKYPYDLTAVLMHDGLFGRNHLYSYTKNPSGAWWKILDYHVSEVSEDTVLNDHFGLHLGGGPVLLLYTKPSNIDPTSTLDYPKEVLEMIDFDNQTFLSNPSEPTSQYVTPNETPAELGQLL